MSAFGMAIGSRHELLGILLALVLYTIIAISEWPLLIRLTQYWAQRQMKLATSNTCRHTARLSQL